MLNHTPLEVNYVTQDWIDNLGWLGSLLLLKASMQPESKSYQLLEQAIALVLPETTAEQAINTFGLKKIMESLKINAESPQNHCPEKLKQWLETIVDEKGQPSTLK